MIFFKILFERPREAVAKIKLDMLLLLKQQ